MQKRYIIAYDISKNKNRKKVSDLLVQYGIRSNFSVFECLLDPGKLNEIMTKIEFLISSQTDRVLIYPVCRNCFMKSKYLGNQPDSIDKTEIKIV